MAKYPAFIAFGQKGSFLLGITEGHASNYGVFYDNPEGTKGVFFPSKFNIRGVVAMV